MDKRTEKEKKEDEQAYQNLEDARRWKYIEGQINLMNQMYFVAKGNSLPDQGKKPNTKYFEQEGI